MPISFAQGLDTKTDDKQVPIGKLLTLQDGIFTSLRRIKKRNGYSYLGNSIDAGGSLAASFGLDTYRDELITYDGFNLYSYSESLSKWSSKGTAEPQIGLSTSAAYLSGLSVEFQDSTYHAASGLQLVTWYDPSSPGDKCSYSIIDQVTGDKIVNGAGIPNASPSVKTLALGSYLVLIYFDFSTSHIRYRAIDTANPTVLPAAVDFTTTNNTTFPTFDAQVINGRIYLAYNNNAGGSGGVSVLYLTSALALSAIFSTNVGDAATCINVFTDPSFNVWVVYHCTAASRIQGFVRDFALTSTVIATTALVSHAVTHVTGVYNSGSSPISATIYYQVSGTVNEFQFAAAGATGDVVILRGVLLESKAFVYNTRTYFWVSFVSDLQPTYFLIDASSGVLRVVVGKLAPNLAGSGNGPGGFLAEVTAVSTGVYQWAYLQETRSEYVSGTNFQFFGVNLSMTSFLNSVQAVEQARDLHFSGGILWMYDSGTPVEHGFHLYPEIVTTASTATTGGSMIPGTYSFVAVYEWTDAQGQLHRSTPSPVPLSKVVPAGTNTNTVTGTVPTLRLTQKTAPTNPVRIVIYRTTANGSIYFEDTGATNSISSDTGSFVSSQSDTSLVAAGQLYTTGGEVENLPVPAPLALATFKDRMVVIPAETPNSWWFSKEIVPGVPVEFSDLLVQNETTTGGPFVTLAQMDDKLCLFKNDTVWYVAGSGPASNGTGNDFTPAQQVTSETGCNNALSMVLTPDGLMYQSPKGIYLLDRSLKDHYVGADVEDYNAYTVTSARLVTGTTQVRFTLNNGTALMYDYFVKQWGGFTDIGAVGTTTYQGNFAFVTASGNVFTETPGTFTDNGTFVPVVLKTSWLSLAGLQGFQRVYSLEILGAYRSSHTLRVQVAYDFDPTIVQTTDITASAVAPYQYKISLTRQKCESVQFTIQDVNSGTPAESLDISAITLEVGVKGGTNRLSQTRTYG